MRHFAVIMAGGSGERFWPASRSARPKQLLPLTDPDRSMLAEAIDRIAPLIPPENVLIATSEKLAGPIRDGLPVLRPENVIAEPEKRNTAACLALAAAHLEQRHGDPEQMAMAVLTADHLIGEGDRFRETVATALEFACTNDALLTIGVHPTRPETGYGYVEVAEAITDTRSNAIPTPRPVVAFREKPDLETARVYAATGRHLWNSGMFFWRLSTFGDGLKRHMPELAKAKDEMVAALTKDAKASLRPIFAPLADVSIDYGLMEKATNVHVVPATFPWDDVGAWDALARTRPPDGDGNTVRGEAVLIDSKDCIVYDDDNSRRAIAIVGLSDVVVATTADGILVCHKDRAQDVRKVVAELRKRGRDDLT